MWLWRAETGLWEPDPATPLNFRGNLLGIAFDPSNPSVGYAVGQQGVLLRYGKTWTQEPEATPARKSPGASFTSIAFAGSEAIVAFRKIHLRKRERSAPLHGRPARQRRLRAGMSTRAPPQALGSDDAVGGRRAARRRRGRVGDAGGLPGSPADPRARILAGALAADALPIPASEAPGSLALFREGGALRAIGSGGAADTTLQIEERTAARRRAFRRT